MRAVVLTLWVLVVLVVVACEVAARRDPRVGGTADLLRAVNRHVVGRAALLVAWMWVGWHFFAR